jgi:hypothetical protein
MEEIEKLKELLAMNQGNSKMEEKKGPLITNRDSRS